MDRTAIVKEAYAKIDGLDVDGFVAMQAADCVWRTPGGELRGHDEVRAFIEGWNEAFPTGEHRIVRSVESGDGVWVEGVWTGTHTGTLQTPAGGVPATGRDVTLPFATIISGSIDERQAERVAIYYDQLGFMAQLGLLPEPAAA
jgi:predicted ester cyclase